MKLYSDVLNKQYFIWFCEGSQRYNLMRCLILASQLLGHISAFLNNQLNCLDFQTLKLILAFVLISYDKLLQRLSLIIQT